MNSASGCAIDRGASGEDALLLREFSHRTANEIAAVSAALHLAARSVSGPARGFVDDAAGRLREFGRLHKILAKPVPARSEVGADLVAVCRTLTAGLKEGTNCEVFFDVDDAWVDGRTARRLVLIGAEIVSNAVRHALGEGGGRLAVSLAIDGGDLVLEVNDDGPGMRPAAATSGTGYGGAIVKQLVEVAGGGLEVDSGPGGTAVRVVLPLHGEVRGHVR